VRAITVSPLDTNLLDAVVRLTREIIYRLLVGEQGARLHHLAILGGYTPHIARAIERLRQDFDQLLHIESLARELGMSVSGLHHHFKAVTALSPLQFQKRLRLLEARRLMLGEDLDAASAAYRVGYHDASHFNREYKSLFGAPRCATCNGCGKGPLQALADEPESTALQPTFARSSAVARGRSP
jgi:AraC-like DNA-binding protein